MLQKFYFGNPVDTGAVVKNVDGSSGNLPYGKVLSSWPFEWTYKLAKDDVIYGLGESMRGQNKRGYKYISWCSDTPNQDETTYSLYGAHNFVIVFGKETFGLFFETPSKITFDIGMTNRDEFKVTTEDTGVNLYVITAEKSDRSVLADITHQFRDLIGQSYIPPFWAFGFQQSRWGYRTEKDVREVVKKYAEQNIPLDSICLDIDYMNSYEDFTLDNKKFPDLSGLCADLKKQGIRLIPIIDAGVKVKKGYSVSDEGVENNYFCKKADGKTDYVAGVWPGRSNFPDFFNPKVREWFGAKYEFLTSQGIEGFWNDMNEPAMFYSDESLKEVYDKLVNTDISNLDIDTFFEFSGLAHSTNNNMEDYKRFYHNYTDKDGNVHTYRHDTVHNMFGGLMTRAAGEGLAKISPDKRKLIYSRASCIGSHRYGGIWTGDVRSWWAHLEQEIKVLPGLNMCGYLYTGADIGGFGGEATRDLVLRWTMLGAFTPLMRNHSAWDCRPQECYRYENPEDFKNVMDLRYALIPYLYSEYIKAAVNSEMYFKPLSFDFPEDKMAVQTEDQLFIGNELMIAPVYKQNADGRYVYLPEDMTKVEWKNSKATETPMKKGIYYVEMPLDSVVFFVRNKKMVPLCKCVQHTDNIDKSSFTYIGEGNSYDLYEDDGYTRDIKLEGRLRKLSK